MKTPISVGQRFSRWTVESFNGVFVSCVCDCGGRKTVKRQYLMDGRSRSCGCFKLDSIRKHGMARTPEHKAWAAMKERCFNPNCCNYQNYGARGITVCDKWKDSFKAFLADVGMRPSPLYSLERIDRKGHYEPGNVKWATRIEQNNNTRRNRDITWRGQTKTLTQWSRDLGIHESTLSKRLLRSGWTVERALTTYV